MQSRGETPERPISMRTNASRDARLPSAVARSRAEVVPTSAGPSVAGEESESRVSSPAVSVPVTRPVRLHRHDTVLSFTELQIIERAKVCS